MRETWPRLPRAWQQGLQPPEGVPVEDSLAANGRSGEFSNHSAEGRPDHAAHGQLGLKKGAEENALRTDPRFLPATPETSPCSRSRCCVGHCEIKPHLSLRPGCLARVSCARGFSRVW